MKFVLPKANFRKVRVIFDHEKLRGINPLLRKVILSPLTNLLLVILHFAFTHISPFHCIALFLYVYQQAFHI